MGEGRLNEEIIAARVDPWDCEAAPVDARHVRPILPRGEKQEEQGALHGGWQSAGVGIDARGIDARGIGGGQKVFQGR